jgi:hypothetical protein
LLKRDTFDLFLPEFDKPWAIHLRETCCCSTNICTWEKHSTFDIENLFGTNSENDDSYFVEFTRTTINKNDYVHMGSINSFMHMAHDKNVLCDSYIVNSIHDATKGYYEREGNMVSCISIILSFPSLY